MPVPSIGSEIAVNEQSAGIQLFPTVAATADGRFVIAWHDIADNHYKARVFRADGTFSSAVDTTIISTVLSSFTNTIENRIELAGLADNDFAAVFTANTNGGDVLYERFTFPSEQSAPSHVFFAPVNADAGTQAGLEENPCVAVSDFGELWIGYTNVNASGDRDLSARGYNGSSLTSNGGTTSAPGDQVQVEGFVPRGSGLVRVFLDVPSGNICINNPANVVGAGSHPHVAELADGGFVVAWDGTAADVLVRVYDYSGGLITARTSAIAVDGAGTAAQSHVCALQDGRLLVVWQEVFVSGQVSTDAVFGRLYGPDGRQDSAAFIIDQFSFPTSGEPVTGAPRAAELADGRVVVTYQDGRASDANIRAKILDPRLEGIILAGSSFDDDHVGTAFGDVFAEGEGNDRVSAGGGNDALIGGLGADTLNGEAGNDILNGGVGNDTLTGGLGDDRYIYAPGGGADSIIGFVAGAGTQDKIDLRAFSDNLYRFQDVLALATQNGSNTVINFGSGDTLTLESVAKTSLAADDFIVGLFQQPSLKLASFGPNAGGWSSNTIYPRELADVDGDGLADIVGFGDDGAYVALATGGANFADPAFQLASFGRNSGGWSSNDLYLRELADVNGDGMADIVGFADGGVQVALATGGGSFGTPSLKLAAFGPSAGGWSSNNSYPRELADVNGDGMADIVGFGDDGVYVALATGGGSFAGPSLVLSAFGPDCLDHVVVFGERPLRHLLGSYQRYYNDARPHLSLNKDAPASRAVQAVGRIVANPHLGGLHLQYVRI